MQKNLSIIVAAYDRPGLLREMLDSLFQLRVPAGVAAEILVVVSSRMLDTVAVVRDAERRSSIPLRLVPERQPGLSRARNQGMEEAAYEYLAYFDDDIRVSPDWLEGFFEAVERTSADCVVGPVSPLHCEPIPPYVSDEVLASIESAYSRKGSEFKALDAATAHEIPGCNFGVRREAALEVGGFDPQLGRAGPVIVAGDDFDFGRRLLAAGRRVVYQPRCSIQHAITAEKLSKSWLRRRWYGNGVFARHGAPDPAFIRSRWGAARAYIAVGRMYLWAFLLRLAGRRAASFAQELHALRALGFIRGLQSSSIPERILRRYRAAALRAAEVSGLARHRVGPPELHAGASIDWILRAQEIGSDGGVPAVYNVLTRTWTPSYPETTGYIICSLLRAANRGFGNPAQLRESAHRMGRWLLTTQMGDGIFPAGHVGLVDPKPAVFNTGQILKGLTDLIQGGRDGDGRFAKSAAAAARWMIGQQDPDGAWRRGVSPLTTEPVRTYYVRAAWPLVRYGKTCGDQGAVETGLRNAAWVLSLQDRDDWFPHMNFDLGQLPFAHTIAYTIQGLLEIGVLCNRPELVEGAERASRRMLALQSPATGALPGQIGPAYRAAADWSGSSANAQMAIVWFRLAEITGERTWRVAGEKANRFNCSIQNMRHRDPGLRGALLSAWPGHRGYTPYRCTNWTQKFHLDALLAQMGVSIV